MPAVSRFARLSAYEPARTTSRAKRVPRRLPNSSVSSWSPRFRRLRENATVPSECVGSTNVIASPTPAIVCEWWIASSFCVCSPSEAGFHQMPSLPGLAATIACPIPTAWAPVGSNRNSAPSLPLGVWAPAARMLSDAIAMLERSRLIDQHNRDVFAHGVAKTAFVAKQHLLLLAVLELTLTFRADEDFQQSRRKT